MERRKFFKWLRIGVGAVVASKIPVWDHPYKVSKQFTATATVPPIDKETG